MKGDKKSMGLGFVMLIAETEEGAYLIEEVEV
jgi:hypothetical protein